MEFDSVFECHGIEKKYRHFTLNVPELRIPKGFATALIGENGAGKTTLLEIMAGVRLSYKGEVKIFGKYNDKDREEDPSVKENIGYIGTGSYFLPQWTIRQVRNLQELLFDNFHPDRYQELLTELSIFPGGSIDWNKKVRDLSDGNRVKLMLAGVLARDTSLLLMDEPASPLDPLMRERLCEMIREYLAREEGERSIVFSTHNVADMESVTDYVVLVEHGEVVEQGFVEDLKEKYLVVKGDKKDEAAARNILYTMSANSYGFEGICLAEKLDALAGLDITTEIPTLSQIVLAIMKVNTRLS